LGEEATPVFAGEQRRIAELALSAQNKKYEATKRLKGELGIKKGVRRK
jgi:hypothetical protein